VRPSWQVDYDCSGCGACCRAIGCTFLAGNRCTIYEDRPDVCRVGYSRPEGMAVEVYLDLTRQACTFLAANYPEEPCP